MKQTAHVILGTLLLLISSCKEKKEQAIKKEETTKTETTTIKESQITKTFAVIGKWTTTDVQLMENNSVTISKELLDLYKKGIVENAYYNANSKIDKFEYFPNITFFLKASNKDAAKQILNNLTIVEEGIISYTLHEVGLKLLGRNTDAIDKNGMTHSFVSVWTTINKPADELKEVQFSEVKNLYEKGTVENVYLDIDHTENETTDFVMYVNANSKEEAQNILNTLPFVKENIATYKLFSVGVFWMGEYQE